MPAAPLLSEDVVRGALHDLPEWRLEDGRLVRRLSFADFAGALAFVNRVGIAAAEMNHHPDVAIHWAELTLTVWRHAVGGLTQRDLRLARAIEDLALSR